MLEARGMAGTDLIPQLLDPGIYAYAWDSVQELQTLLNSMDDLQAPWTFASAAAVLASTAQCAAVAVMLQPVCAAARGSLLGEIGVQLKDMLRFLT